MPHESPDARNDPPNQAPCQVALGQLQDEVPGRRRHAPLLDVGGPDAPGRRPGCPALSALSRSELIATIDDPAVIHRILAHLGCRAHGTARSLRSRCLHPETTSPRAPSRSRSDVPGPPAWAVVCPYPGRAMASGTPRHPAAAV